MNREEAVTKIREYFENNEEEFNEAIEELDGYNGYLGDDRYYDMVELDEFYHDTLPSELLMRVYYGHDEKSGESSEFCPNREYFRYNGYGNLVSADYKDYSDHLDDYFVEEYIDNIADMWNIPSEVQEIIDAIEEE